MPWAGGQKDTGTFKEEEAEVSLGAIKRAMTHKASELVGDMRGAGQAAGVWPGVQPSTDGAVLHSWGCSLSSEPSWSASPVLLEMGEVGPRIWESQARQGKKYTAAAPLVHAPFQGQQGRLQPGHSTGYLHWQEGWHPGRLCCAHLRVVGHFGFILLEYRTP